METNTDEIQVFEGEQLPSYQMAQRAQIDSQVATAKAYPRDLRKCTDNAVVIVTMSKETAISCGYELPRAGKKIRGASVHLASILAQSYGNLRAEARVTEVAAKFVSAEAVAFDLETNFAVKVEVRRKILNKHGERFNEDMIHTTGLAAASIAYRNAVLRVIPRAIVDKVYKAAQNMITGDLSDEQKLLKARTDWIKHYKGTYEATDAEILDLCGVKSVQGIKAEQIATLIGVDQSIKDGEVSVDSALGRDEGENRDQGEVERKGQEFYDEDPDKKGKKDDKKSSAPGEKSDGKLPM